MTPKEEVIEAVEIAMALELLAYHDKNYLNHEMCQENKRSREMIRLLSKAHVFFAKDFPDDQ